MGYNGGVNQSKIQILFFFVLLVGVAFLTFLVFKPFIGVLTLAAVASVLFESLHKKILSVSGRYKSLASATVVFLVALFVILPLFYVSANIFQQTQNIYAVVSGDTAHYLSVLDEAVEALVQRVYPDFTFNSREYAVYALRFISDNLSGFLSSLVATFFHTFLFLLAFFFFLRDGERMLAFLMSVSPFESRHTLEIVNTTRHRVVSVIRETLVIIVIRWLLVWFGFYVCGIPSAVFWGSLAGILGAIPSLGTPIVIIPAAIYLYYQGAVVSAIGIILVGLFIMLVIENILAPYMLGKGFDISPLFAILSVFGGLVLFGPFGIIFGPIILSLFLSAIHMYKVLCLEKSAY